MERPFAMYICGFFLQNLAEIIILKCKASMWFYQFGLISWEDMTFVISAGKHLWTTEERIAVPLQQCVIFSVGCSALQHLVGVQPVCAQASRNLYICSPQSRWRGAWGRGGCSWSVRSHLQGKGRNCWCGLCGMSGRMESIVRKASSGCYPGIICIGNSGYKIHKKIAFILILIISKS